MGDERESDCWSVLIVLGWPEMLGVFYNRGDGLSDRGCSRGEGTNGSVRNGVGGRFVPDIVIRGKNTNSQWTNSGETEHKNSNKQSEPPEWDLTPYMSSPSQGISIPSPKQALSKLF
ncbi:hypothetical protein CEXT_386451 [Caerostris extrusa]|uniref:Uncharacterized protein n=1 Tax=Caerostris extrusa TaxID=172846 RepID=A0AAV4W6L9_CAEEX|nr:hypothetical protein CEXT_386451 [Caerostris extrusa]